MNLKSASLLAFIGSLLILVVSLLWLINGFIQNNSYKLFDIVPSNLLSIIAFLGELFIVLFFFSIYKKQN